VPAPDTAFDANLRKIKAKPWINRGSITRLAAVGALALLAYICYWLYGPRPQPRSLEIKWTYLLVAAEGPDDWQNKHSLCLVWNGERIVLPALFRAPHKNGSNDSFPVRVNLALNTLEFNGREIPMEVVPADAIAASYQPSFAFLNEDDSSGSKVVISLVNSVAVTPKGHSTRASRDFLRPNGNKDAPPAERFFDNPVTTQVKALISQGKVIELTVD